MRRLIIACLALAVSLPVQAGDRATPYFLGFSAEGRYAAFEEYGVQDGSGFAYARIVIIDVVADAWVGTPFEAMIREDAAPSGVSRAREAAHAAAADEIARLGIAPRGREAARAASDDLADGLSIADAGFGRVRFSVRPKAVPDAACPYDDRPVAGFALERLTETGAVAETLHEDVRIPASRACPWDYGVSSVHMMPRPGRGPAVVVLIAYDRLGFEGPDRRHLAVAKTYDAAPD